MRSLVLVVDDDPDMRTVASMQLSHEGYDVIEAPNGRGCIEMAATRSPDVILLDMMLPDMDGGAVLNALASNPRTAEIPVVFLSAITTTDDRVRALEGGAVDWINKPADPRDLIARVGAAARTKARQDEIRMRAGGDAVTRLMGRDVFETRLRRELSRSARTSSHASVLLIKIDAADEVINRHGIAVSDRLRSEISRVLRSTLRTSDELFHYGPDEFAALLPDTEVATAFLAAERCREAAASVATAPEPPSVSVGVAQSMPGRTADEVLARAEIALFRARDSGGDRSWRADDPRRHGLNPVSLSQELTEREWDVLVNLSQKRTEHEIARRLGITRGTVRSHKARIRRKLHVPPDMRLSEFVRVNFKDLIDRLQATAG
ncbi:MAG TPA: response regulator [Actinomycetota bacterium]|nr:response regulator [Actinomycetota bacterium]